ncbi:hypothetical protein OQA88_2712 [Cercophora sp. LCS_1]
MRAQSLPLLFLAAIPALGWDGFGHQTVGFIAQKYFSAEANETIGALLNLGDNFDIGDAAAWADTVRDRDNLPWSKNWHFINPKGDDPENHICLVNYLTDCVNNNCIIAAIMNQTSIVLDTTKPLDLRRNATMFLIHFFGDLHQPMHTSGFKLGGNAVRPVCWGIPAPCESNRTLHSVWDSAISRKLRGLSQERDDKDPAEDKVAAKAWAEDIYDLQQVSGVEPVGDVCAQLSGPECILRWATESNRLTCSNALKNGEKWVKSNDLSGEYYQENVMVVQSQVGKAGLRAAAWMNALAKKLNAEEVGDL